jgi:septal ring factor EnvC (AmiA/AmiB activator)
MIKQQILFILSLLAIATTCKGQPLKQTQIKLEKVTQEIGSLKTHLQQSKTQRDRLTNTLALTEKRISDNVQHIKKLDQAIQQQTAAILPLQQKTKQLEQQLHDQSRTLNEHLLFLYKTGDTDPLKCLLNLEDPNEASHLLTLNQYMLQARHHIIQTIQKTQNELSDTQHQLTLALEKAKTLTNTLLTQQQKMRQNKQHAQTLIQQLEVAIETDETKLLEQQQNRRDLSHLIRKFTPSRKPTNIPFTWPHIKNGMTQPLNHVIAKQAINHGVTLFSTEGEPVFAVTKGTVVFSNWLKGYGLLLIIRHQNGYMTLYGHNQALMKRTGDQVQGGEQIATVGHSGGLKENGLYFEVRHAGRVVPALQWLG